MNPHETNKLGKMVAVNKLFELGFSPTLSKYFNQKGDIMVTSNGIMMPIQVHASDVFTKDEKNIRTRFSENVLKGKQYFFHIFVRLVSDNATDKNHEFYILTARELAEYQLEVNKATITETPWGPKGQDCVSVEWLKPHQDAWDKIK